MINGDIVPRHNQPRDLKGFIRVQLAVWSQPTMMASFFSSKIQATCRTALVFLLQTCESKGEGCRAGQRRKTAEHLCGSVLGDGKRFGDVSNAYSYTVGVLLGP